MLNTPIHTVPLSQQSSSLLASHTPVQPVPLSQQNSSPLASHTPVQPVPLAQQNSSPLASHTPVQTVQSVQMAHHDHIPVQSVQLTPRKQQTIQSVQLTDLDHTPVQSVQSVQSVPLSQQNSSPLASHTPVQSVQMAHRDHTPVQTVQSVQLTPLDHTPVQSVHNVQMAHRDHTHYRNLILLLTGLLITLTACGSSTTNAANRPLTPTAQQVLILPNVGTREISTLDPAQGPDSNAALAISMIYSGLVKMNKNLNILPDQASWKISPDNKIYTFYLQPSITFSDSTPVTAQSYVYTLTRALLPEVKSPTASFFERLIVGADAVKKGKTQTLTGIKAIDDHTLQITLTHPTPYFLAMLTNPLYFPLNQKLIAEYGQTDWTNHAADNGIGTGPFIVKEWDHNIKMILVPNPHYYGPKTKLKEVDMIFVGDLSAAFKAYRAGQYSLDWNILPTDLAVARGSSGFTIASLLQTDLLFFSNTMPPFDNPVVRQAFAYATDKVALAHTIFADAVIPAPTIIPPGIPGYQPDFPGLPFDIGKAKTLLQSVYPDLSQVPPITFSYPSSQVSSEEAAALQQMWQQALDIQVQLRPVELNAYNDEAAKHHIQFGFTQHTADFPDPYDLLSLNLLSTSPNNNGHWHNPTFDYTVTQAEMTSGDARIALYNKAEQTAITDVGWLPLDHETVAAIIPPWVHGVSLNHQGLFFSDWSDVYLLQH